MEAEERDRPQTDKAASAARGPRTYNSVEGPSTHHSRTKKKSKSDAFSIQHPAHIEDEGERITSTANTVRAAVNATNKRSPAGSCSGQKRPKTSHFGKETIFKQHPQLRSRKRRRSSASSDNNMAAKPRAQKKTDSRGHKQHRHGISKNPK